MKEILVDKLIPGMRLAEPLMKSNTKLLDAGSKLTQSQIDKIVSYWPKHYINVLEDDEELETVQSNDAGTAKDGSSSDSSFNINLGSGRRFFAPDLKNETENLEELILNRDYFVDAIKLSLKIPLIKQLMKGMNIKNVYKPLVDISQVRTVLLNTGKMAKYDHALFQHSVNVCILAAIIAQHLDENDERVCSLVGGALLHDIGKVPCAYENSDEEQKNLDHCTKGYNILKQYRNIGPVASHIAYQHHEDYIGTGYPRRLADKQILHFARITRVLNDFERLSLLSSSDSSLVVSAANVLVDKREILYDPEIVDQFLAMLNIINPGSPVRLNTGEIAVVMKSNKEHPLHSRVKVFCNKDGSISGSFQVLDLSHEPAIKIVQIMN